MRGERIYELFPRSNWQQIPWTLNQTAPQFVAFNNGLDCVMEPLLLEARCEISDIPLTSDTLIVEKYQKEEENKQMTFLALPCFSCILHDGS